MVSYRAGIVQSPRSSRPAFGFSFRNSAVVTPTSPVRTAEPADRNAGGGQAEPGTVPGRFEPSTGELPCPLPPSELLRIGATSLMPLEYAQIRLVRASLQPGVLEIFAAR